MVTVPGRHAPRPETLDERRARCAALPLANPRLADPPPAAPLRIARLHIARPHIGRPHIAHPHIARPSVDGDPALPLAPMSLPGQVRRRAPRREHLASTSAIATAFLLVFVAALALNMNLHRMRDSFAWVDHTDHVLLSASILQNELVETSAAARTFAVIGDARALDRMHAGTSRIPGMVDALQALCTDSPPQVARVQEMRGNITKYLSWEESEARAHQQDPANHVPLTETTAARQWSAGIRTELGEFRSTEIALLTERQRMAGRNATIAAVLAMVTTLLALVSGGLGIVLLLRERQRSRLRVLETELIHVSRLNTVGQTASVLAHEVNQPLTATRNYVSGARRLLKAVAAPEAARASEALQLAQAQVERATQIIARLRRHVQGTGPDRSAAEPATLIEEAILLSGERNGDIAMHTDLERHLPDVFVDAVQVQQVLINLIRNAAEAMADSPRRELHVGAARDGEAVRITVRDTGAGLSPELADRLFMPFTSTKPNGMGIGLSICRSIIEQHGGRIWAERRTEGGTAFHFTIPCVRNQAAPESTPRPEHGDAPGGALHSAG
jgi:two-component system, LuxR family, sensor kinase FixL